MVELFARAEPTLYTFLLLAARGAGFFGMIQPCRTYLRGAGMGALVLAAALWELSLGGVPIAPQLGVFSPFIEASVGACAALPLALSWELLPSAGRLIDLIRGAQLSEQLSPLSGERKSSLEEGLGLIGAGALLTMGGGLAVFAVFHHSTVEIVGLVREGAFTSGVSEILPAVDSFSASFLSAVLLFIAPILLFVTSWEVLSAFLSKAMPRANFQSELGVAKGLGGIFLLAMMASRPQSYVILVQSLAGGTVWPR